MLFGYYSMRIRWTDTIPYYTISFPNGTCSANLLCQIQKVYCWASSKFGSSGMCVERTCWENEQCNERKRANGVALSIGCVKKELRNIRCTLNAPRTMHILTTTIPHETKNSIIINSSNWLYSIFVHDHIQLLHVHVRWTNSTIL